jgi:hypothetical protein
MKKFVRGLNSKSTESKIKLRRVKVVIAIQMFTTLVFIIWSLYVWIKGSHFGSQPECNHLVKYVFIFANVHVTETWLRVLFITYLCISSCAGFILVALVYMDDPHGRWNIRYHLGLGEGDEQLPKAFAQMVLFLSFG